MTTHPELIETPEKKRKHRLRGIRVRTVDEQHFTSRDIHPPDEFRKLIAHDVDAYAFADDDGMSTEWCSSCKLVMRGRVR